MSLWIGISGPGTIRNGTGETHPVDRGTGCKRPGMNTATESQETNEEIFAQRDGPLQDRRSASSSCAASVVLQLWPTVPCKLKRS